MITDRSYISIYINIIYSLPITLVNNDYHYRYQ